MENIYNNIFIKDLLSKINIEIGIFSFDSDISSDKALSMINFRLIRHFE